MTRSRLEEYCDVVAEIKDLERRLRNPVYEVVSASEESFPYTKGTARVSGVPDADLYRNRLEQLKAQKAEIEHFIDVLPFSRQRRVVRLRVMDLLSWNDIAAKMGYMHSEDSLRKCYTRAVESAIQRLEEFGDPWRNRK